MSYHLRLCKALSYSGVVTATAKNPDVYVNDEATANAAVATGYFKLVEGEAESTDNTAEQESGKPLDKMTVSELETCAAYYGVSLKGVTKKADIITKLKAELGNKAEGNVCYGSPTVTELQQEY